MLASRDGGRASSIPVAVFPLRPQRTFWYAPPGRDRHKAKFAEGPAGRNPHYGCKGGVGELYIRQLFHGHPGPHRRGHDLYYLHGLFPNDMCAENVPRLAVDEKLAEALRVSVDDAAIQFRVRYHSHGVVVPFAASPIFGETHTGVLWVGEAAVRHDSVPVTMFPAEHGLFGGEIPLVGGALHQHHSPRYVPGSKDVWSAGPEGIIHLHVAAASRLHAHGLQVQPLHVSRPADREYDGLRKERVCFVVLCIEQAWAPVLSLDLFHTSDAGNDLDPPAFERRVHSLRYRLILGCQDARRDLQQRHPRAERRKHRGQLAARRSAAYHGD